MRRVVSVTSRGPHSNGSQCWSATIPPPAPSLTSSLATRTPSGSSQKTCAASVTRPPPPRSLRTSRRQVGLDWVWVGILTLPFPSLPWCCPVPLSGLVLSICSLALWRRPSRSTVTCTTHTHMHTHTGIWLVMRNTSEQTHVNKQPPWEAVHFPRVMCGCRVTAISGSQAECPTEPTLKGNACMLGRALLMKAQTLLPQKSTTQLNTEDATFTVSNRHPSLLRQI